MRSTLALYAPLGVALVLSGCGGNGNASNTPMVRALNAVPAYPVATVVDGFTIVGSSLLYATQSGNTHFPYSNVGPGAQTVTFASGGQVFASADLVLANQQFANVIASNSAAGATIVLSDDTVIVQDSEVRLVNATNFGGLDVVLTLPGASSLPPITVAGGAVIPAQPAFPGFQYQVMDPGAYRIQVFPTGQENNAAPYLDGTINLSTARRWTLVLANAVNSNSQAVLVQVQDNQQLSGG